MRLEVFDYNFTRLGAINTYSMIRYTSYFSGVGSFELTCPLSKQNIDLLLGAKERIIWLEGNIAGVVQYNKRESSSKVLSIKGSLIEVFLDWRVINPGFYMYGRPDSIIKELVRANCTIGNRSLPHFIVEDTPTEFDYSIAFQNTGSSVAIGCNSVGESHNLGYEVQFLPKESIYLFKTIKGKDRTYGNLQGNPPIVFSRELNNILDSYYLSNLESLRTTAIVAGEGEGENRATILINDSNQGFSRKELYVDARDLQSTVGDVQLTEVEYERLLNQRGIEKLQESSEVESFEAKVRTDSSTLFKYGVDYYKGDRVTVVDKELGISLSAIVTSITVTKSETGYEVEPTFGFGQPTLVQKLKKKGVL